jgi:hypothetical protein
MKTNKKSYTQPTCTVDSTVDSLPRMQLLTGSGEVPIDPDIPTGEALAPSFDSSWEDVEED